MAGAGAGCLRRVASALLLPSPRLSHRELSAPAGVYHKKAVDHYENPRNVGSLGKTSKNLISQGMGKREDGGGSLDHQKQISPRSSASLVLAEDAIKAALADYKLKRNPRKARRRGSEPLAKPPAGHASCLPTAVQSPQGSEVPRATRAVRHAQHSLFTLWL
ncbi:hypothetical protein HPG69_006535 [Diceros bicornis minor]|uniref:Uncharacterized protein n=1 Tax=Diceros bicornis minor TaxID=77932 RepID=A0A7J7F6R2_DICBM|nr:hypothetical protein HPG69_006535 [Diceros bicornis minor]